MSAEGIRFEVADHIGWIILSRPDRKNAFTLAMIDAWANFLRDARTRNDIRVIVLTADGDSFCSGIDLDHWAEMDPTPVDWFEILQRIHRVALALEDLDKPVIASVNGIAIGAGMDMALMCDIRLLSDTASLSEGYIKVGLVPGDGGCYFLPRLIGPAKALELLWTGDRISAEEAKRLGIANHVYPAADLQQKTVELASKLANSPPIALALIKRAVYQGLNTPVQHALSLIKSHMVVVQSTADAREALAAFKEKRPAVYHGT